MKARIGCSLCLPCVRCGGHQRWWPGPGPEVQCCSSLGPLGFHSSLSQAGAPQRRVVSEQPCCPSQPLGLGPRPLHASEDGDRHSPAGLVGSAQPAFSGQEAGGPEAMRGSSLLGEPGLTVPRKGPKEQSLHEHQLSPLPTLCSPVPPPLAPWLCCGYVRV